MKLKSEAHECLSIILKHDDVPPKIVVDDSKYQSLGKLASKLWWDIFTLQTQRPITHGLWLLKDVSNT